MKLPAFKHGAVQSLGKHDPYGPVRVGQARAQAVTKVTAQATKALQAWGDAEEDQRVAGAITGSKNEKEQVYAYLTSQKSIDLNLFPDFEVVEGMEVTEVPQPDGTVKRMVPAYQVISSIWETEKERINAKYMDGIKLPKSRGKYSASMGEYDRPRGTAITAQRFKQQYEALNANAKLLWSQAINNLDEKMANAILDSGVKQGILSYEDYRALKIKTGQEIDYMTGLSVINKTTTTEGYSQIIYDIIHKSSRMTTKQKTSLISQSKAARNRLEDKLEKDYDDHLKKLAADTQLAFLTNKMSAAEYAEKVAKFRPSDRIAAYAKIYTKEPMGPGNSDPDVKQLFGDRIAALANSDTPEADRKSIEEDLVTALVIERTLHGYDKMALDKRLAEGYLITRVNRGEKDGPLFKSESYLTTKRNINMDITGATEVTIRDLGQGDKTQGPRWYDAHRDIRIAMRAKRGLNPEEWWNENRDNYMRGKWEADKLTRMGVILLDSEKGVTAVNISAVKNRLRAAQASTVSGNPAGALTVKGYNLGDRDIEIQLELLESFKNQVDSFSSYVNVPRSKKEKAITPEAPTMNPVKNPLGTPDVTGVRIP